MSEPDLRHQLMGVLIRTAEAHHEATGGTNPQWATWYSERAVDEVNRLLERGFTIDGFADWLTEADRRYRAEQPEVSWPKAYVGWLFEEEA